MQKSRNWINILMPRIKGGPFTFLVSKLHFTDELIPLGYIHFITILSGLCSKTQN